MEPLELPLDPLLASANYMSANLIDQLPLINLYLSMSKSFVN